MSMDELFPAVKTEAVLWSNIAEAMRLLRKQFDEQSKTGNSISFRQRLKNFEWAEREVMIRERSAITAQVR